MTALLCRMFGHRWMYWQGGHVHAGDDWDGEWNDSHPWINSFSQCRRCGATKR